MSEQLNAAERLRRITYEGMGDWIDPVTGQGFDADDMSKFYGDVASIHLEETDPTPADEAWVESLKKTLRIDGTWRWYHIADRTSILVKHGGDSITFWYSGTKLLDNPTRGEVRTACRLFKVQLKEVA